MKNIRLVGRLGPKKNDEVYEGIRIIFNSPPVVEMVERFNAVVSIGLSDDKKIASLEITFTDRWDENSPYSFKDFDDGATGELKS